MSRIRQVDDVSIVDWGGGDGSTLAGEVRALIEAGTARRLLLNMAGCDGMRADDLETLTEAFTVCEDRGCAVGMFAVSDGFARLVEVMELGGDLPPVVGRAEPDAIAALRPAQQNGKAPAKAPTPAPAAQRPAAAPKQHKPPQIEIDLESATAPTARFDHQQVVSMSFGSKPPTPPSAAGQVDTDLLGIDWGPLVATGYAIGGPNPDAVIAMGKSSPSATAAAPKPVAAKPPAADDDDVIDLGDVAPARVPAGGPPTPRSFKTETMPAFKLEDEPAPSAAGGWSAKPAAPAGDLAARTDLEPARVLGGTEDGDFSPLDTGSSPPAFLRGAPAAPAARAPGPALPPPQQRPSADRRSERFTPGRGPGAPVQPPVQAPAPARAPAAAAQVAPQQAQSPAMGGHYEAGLGESDDQTVMFQPGFDMAELARIAAEAAGEPAPVATAAPAPVATQAAPAAAPIPVIPTSSMSSTASDDDEALQTDDETVMFQPGMFDAKLLAEVAAVAGPEVGVPPPKLEEPPPPTPPPGLPNDARDVELRLFMHDHALASDLHLQVLDRLLKANENPLGRNDLQLQTGGALAAVGSICDQLVQSKIVRRTRSPRVRGGTGFVLGGSPQTKSTLLRLLKAWQAPNTRAKVAGWFEVG